MKVLYLVSSYPYEHDPYGGVFFQNQAEALRRCGVDIEVLVVTPWTPPFVEFYSRALSGLSELPSERCINGVPVRVVRYPMLPKMGASALSHPWIAWAVKRVLREIPDLIHGNYGYPLGAVAARLGQELNIHAVVTLRGDDVNTLAARSAKHRAILRQTADSATLIAVSRALCEKTYELIGTRPTYLPVGIQVTRFPSRESRAELRASLGIAASSAALLFVGNFIVEKGLRELIQALQMLQQSSVLYAAGAGPLEAELRATPGVHVLGALPNEQVARYMKACDLLVLPTYNEGLPNVLLEAGATGIPIVATNVGGIPQLLGADGGLMVGPRDPRALVDAIHCCLADSEGARERSERLRERIFRDYDIDRNARRLRDLYALLLECGAGCNARLVHDQEGVSSQ
ncbi:MAG TPA: glycosyltransferase [Terracidiphilus sp.]|jgi:teichuronic acid biosynthesis glycosyltransferase TuaC